MVDAISSSFYSVPPSLLRTVQTQRSFGASTLSPSISDTIAQQNNAQLLDTLANINTPVVGDGPVPSRNLAGDTLLQAQEAFADVDVDASGGITQDEFASAVNVSEGDVLDRLDLEELFTASDLNEDGVLNEGEFTTAALLDTLDSVVEEFASGRTQLTTGTPVTFYDPRDTNLDGVIDARERLADLLGQTNPVIVPEEDIANDATPTSMMSYLLALQEAQQGTAVV